MAQQSPCQAYLHAQSTCKRQRPPHMQQAHAQPTYLANVASLSSIASYTSSLRSKSPGLLGRMCTCTCGTDCPALAPSCQHGGTTLACHAPLLLSSMLLVSLAKWVLPSRHGPVWPESVRRLQIGAAQRCPLSSPASCQQPRKIMDALQASVMCDSINGLDWWPRFTRGLQPPHLKDAHIGAPRACC